jgi:hypothetical protein
LSLVSELIAELRALLEQIHEAQNGIQTARDQVETALGVIREATQDSSNDLVTEGTVQWRLAVEKLDEARAVLAGGDAAMEQYIFGPLLGGSGGGGTPPGRPPAPAPSPGPDPEDRSKRQRDPGGGTPPAVPPLVRQLGVRLPEGGKGRQTVIFAVNDDESMAIEFSSGRDDSTKEGLKPAYQRLIIMDHAEAKLAAAIRSSEGGARHVTAVINNEPCPGPAGCDAVLPGLIPSGTTVSLYVKTDEGTLFYGEYQGNGKAIA